MLRYHEFIPRPYLEFGSSLLRNGVDRRDVASATVASIQAALDRRFELLITIVHTNHGMPAEVVNDFRIKGPTWCESQVEGAQALIAKYAITLPEQVEQHDLSEAESVLGWKPQIGFLDFLRDLKLRDERGIDVKELFIPSELPEV
ncbi:hypothetical protein Back11_51540 [Paenibacillus baekrokdamisoli]|uniref:NAD(P)-binding domain-containing protein n=1 Tax=Paenibacillus baekrokdamisoli TaxID=1712516 RepID=A0A3G9JL96_9BACL|nr:hypothetical protein [Paenibacillus baekrokdamisoli]BBH23809.1 hypothetical protein Back11_51540 [Paenibacillus baekrokdamisoli]